MFFSELHPALGVEVHGLDLTSALTKENFLKLRGAFNAHGVILIRNQNLNEKQHVSFAKRFGDLMIHVLEQYLTTPYPEIYVLSNKIVEGKPIGNHKEGWNWHSDLSYYEVPCLGSVLYAREVPDEDGDTLFASMSAAYEALAEEQRRDLEGLNAVHSYTSYYSKAFADRAPLSEKQKMKTPDVVHPIVRTHSETGRKSLYVGEDIISHIVGLEHGKSASLLDKLNKHAVSSPFVYRHKWRAGDVIIWDNRSTMHRATPYDDVKYTRVMHRATIKGTERPQ